MLFRSLKVTNWRVCVAKPLSEISKSQTWVFVFCKGQRKKESVVSKLARDHVSKFLLVGNNKMLVV